MKEHRCCDNERANQNVVTKQWNKGSGFYVHKRNGKNMSVLLRLVWQENVCQVFGGSHFPTISQSIHELFSYIKVYFQLGIKIYLNYSCSCLVWAPPPPYLSIDINFSHWVYLLCKCIINLWNMTLEHWAFSLPSDSSFSLLVSLTRESQNPNVKRDCKVNPAFALVSLCMCLVPIKPYPLLNHHIIKQSTLCSFWRVTLAMGMDLKYPEIVPHVPPFYFWFS